MSHSYYCHPTAVIDSGAEIGEGTKIWHFTHIRENAKIGKHCVIGQGVYIDTGAVIGDHVHIQNNVNVYKGVILQDRVFVGPCATFTNDMYPRAGSITWQPISTLVCTGASIGANATILCGITIGEYAMVVAAACVTDDVPPHAMVKGVPAKVCGVVCKCGQPVIEDQNGFYKCHICNFELKTDKFQRVNK